MILFFLYLCVIILCGRIRLVNMVVCVSIKNNRVYTSSAPSIRNEDYMNNMNNSLQFINVLSIKKINDIEFSMMVSDIVNDLEQKINYLCASYK